MGAITPPNKIYRSITMECVLLLLHPLNVFRVTMYVHADDNYSSSTSLLRAWQIA